MNCANRDADLLLLAHGELTFWQCLGVYLHLGRCSDCRQRLRRFGATSATLAMATRPTLALASEPTALMRPAIASIAVWLISIVFIIAIGVWVGAARSSGVPPSPAPRCAPDLESDRCR